ncbi:hypothetical protein QBC44DRAFT_273469 [Cladorrhinum sp. PSN332]|nr:hypothetical protein QBC44DRAFT_273469 [Cladorrhinum sp. PSN332]
MLPPSRVKKMPQPAAQLLSIARSPRKQMFELDIGNEQSPQRLFVTVEAGENAGTIPNNNRNIKRRLFQSPTPTPSRRAMSQIKNSAVTTTTVPLHGITDDEGATPKKRGRPRKSGTPVPTKPKRQGTPRRVGRPPRAASPHKDFPTSDLGFEDVDATPRARPAAQSPRKSTKRKTMSPSKGDGAADGQPPRKRGRPRKSEVTASIAEMLAQATAAETTAQSNVPVERLEEPTLPTERRQPAVAEASGDQGGDDFEDDIWLNTLSDQPAQPATHSWGYRIPTSPSPRRPAQPEAAPTSESHFHDEEVWAEMHDGPADDYSDAGSVRGQSHDREDRQDTVMGNEDFTNFTRISISELPSMQMNSSVMAHQQQEEDLGEETSLIIERTMDYLRQSRNKATAEVPEEIPEEVSYPHLPSAERRAQTRFLPKPPQSSPKAWWNQAPKRPKRKKQPLSKTLGLKALLDEANAREAGQGPSTFQEPDVSGYNDSFSTIPDSVLIAATPRKPLRLPVENEELEEVDAQEDEIPSEQIQPSIERQSTVNPSIPQSETNRLLTPDETSSPIPPEDGELQPEPQLSGPALEVEMPSSPPVSNPSPPPQQLLITSFSSHMRSNSTETPADQLSSFRSGSTANLNAQQQAIPQPSLTLPEPVHRPSLSPIVRAGQRLQQVTSDPPSPPARDNMLGSPFRGSITKSSQSPAPFIAPARIVRSPTTEAPQEEDEPRPWSNPLATVKNFVSNAARAISPRRRGSLPGTELLEDPFGPDPAERARSGEARKTLFSPANQVVDRDATISATGSPKPASVRDDDAMSWQGESSPVRDPVIEEQKFASPTSSVFAAHGSFLSTVPERTPFSLGVAAARAQAQQPQEEEEEEEDLFLLEAQRPTPFVARHAPLEEQTNVEPPRRATIASPWNRRERQDRQRPGYNDENRPLTQSVSANGDHELSLLSQVNENRAPARSRPAPAPATAKKQPAFADLFSPMATLPPNTQGVPGTGVFPAPEARRAERTRTERPVPNLTAAVRRLQPSGNSLFPECIAAEPVEKPQSIPQKRLEIGNRRPSVDLFSPVRKPAEEEPDEEEEGQEQDSPLPARSLLPRRNSIFGAINSIPKLFSSYQRPQPAEQQEPQQVREPQEQPRPSHEGREEDYRHASELHTTPPHPEPRHRAASPSKSCIRSPEKGKTPGRVVEFTSSTLSPLTQAEQEDEVELPSNSNNAPPAPVLPPPTKKLPPLPPPPKASVKPTQSRTHFTPAPAPQKPTWTNSHWELLACILQLRRAGQLPRAPPPPPSSSSPLLGKVIGKVNNPDQEHIVLEQWHVDIIHAFKKEMESPESQAHEVERWDELDLARRLFAVILGEQRRREGKVDRRRRLSDGRYPEDLV